MPGETVLKILDLLLARTETQFEATQPFVGHGSPAQVQGLETLGRTSLDRLPHQQVVRPQMLKRILRGAELVNRLGTGMNKNCGRYRPRVQPRQPYKALAVLQKMAPDVLKETKRLRWKAMLMPGLAMEGIESAHGLKLGAKLHAQ